MIELSSDDKIQLSRILESVKGRVDDKLCKLIMDLVFKTRITTSNEDQFLYSTNIEQIPQKSIDAFSLGSFFGQTYQISIDLAKKMNLKLDSNQKRLLREFTFFLVLFKFEIENKK